MATGWALASSASYGVSDFVGGLASKRAKPIKVVLVSYPISTLLIWAAAVVRGGHATWSALLWGSLSGILMGVAMLAFYDALARGPMSLVSPITAVLVALIPLAIGIGTGERLSATASVGLMLALLAILLVSGAGSGNGESVIARKTLAIAVVAGSCFALSFVATKQISAEAGLWPLVVARGSASVLLAFFAIAKRELGAPKGRTLVLAAAVGVLDAVANTTMMWALQGGQLVTGSTIIALYPAFTVGLAILLLKERLTRPQAIGLLAAAIGVALISIGK